MAANAKTLFSGKTHNTAGRNGGARSSDGFLDLKMSQRLVDQAHQICPYSKAVRGKIDVTTTVV